MLKRIIIATGVLMINKCWAQDSIPAKATSNWSQHFQLTVIGQQHTAFKAKYSGRNSLADTIEPIATSLTTTIFLGRKLWKNAAFYFNPEISGGNGLSFSTGVAGAFNGETYRIGEVKPQVFVARAYVQQHIPLGGTGYTEVEDDVNQVAGKIPTKRITISAGKFAVADFYDNNTYSKDPRTQFFNWSVWANGAWDYPANTRGYTYGIVTELIVPNWAVRFSSVAVPRIANFHYLEYKITKAHSETLEAEHSFMIQHRPGTVRFFISHTRSQEPSYKSGLKAIAENDPFLLSVIQGLNEYKTYGGKKLGIGLNMEQQLSNTLGVFSRMGWNDGRYATWAFTEIDNTLNGGFSLKGIRWKRPDDVVALAVVSNGLAADHKNFLKAGGYGFIIGDGRLNYGREFIVETYYNAKINSYLWLSLDYQFVNNPGYNKDRGPVHVIGLRAHVEL
jgi:hypothetical protein